MSADIKYLQERIAQSDEGALTHLYQHFFKKLLNFSVELVRSKETAEEIVEDVFVQIWQRRSNICTIENLAVYLYVAVKNRSLNKLSEKAQYLIAAPFDHLDTHFSDTIKNPSELMITAEMIQLMQKAIDILPPRCKMIFKLVREDGLKYKEVAQILNISVNTIDAQMAIAVKRICMALNISKNDTHQFSFNTAEKKK